MFLNVHQDLTVGGGDDNPPSTLNGTSVDSSGTEARVMKHAVAHRSIHSSSLSGYPQNGLTAYQMLWGFRQETTPCR
jgi:hypothetical protein